MHGNSPVSLSNRTHFNRDPLTRQTRAAGGVQRQQGCSNLQMVDTLSRDPVDAMLRHARQLLGTMNPVQLDVAFRPARRTRQLGQRDAAAAAADTGTLLAERAADHRPPTRAVAAAIAEANEIPATPTSNSLPWKTRGPATSRSRSRRPATDDAQAGLLHAAQQHVLDVTAVVQTAAEQFQAAAQRIAAKPSWTP